MTNSWNLKTPNEVGRMLLNSFVLSAYTAIFKRKVQGPLDCSTGGVDISSVDLMVRSTS